MDNNIYFLSDLNGTFPELIGAGIDDAGSPQPPKMINKPKLLRQVGQTSRRN